MNSLKWRRRPDKVPANNMRQQSYTRRDSDNASSPDATTTSASQAGLACARLHLHASLEDPCCLSYSNFGLNLEYTAAE